MIIKSNILQFLYMAQIFDNLLHELKLNQSISQKHMLKISDRIGANGGRGPVRGPPHQLLITLIIFNPTSIAYISIASQ